LNIPQLEMVKKVSRGRIIVVGDSRQCIYSFRGCHPQGMKMMRDDLNAAELKLTTSYRCSKAVIRHAQSIVPDINAADNANEGEVTSVKNCDDARPGDFILSRLNAPLMPLALNLLRQKIPARIEGRDIGRQLMTMVKSQKAKSVPHFFEKINSWFDKQVARIGKGKNADKKLEVSKDILDTLSALAENCANVAEVEQRIYSLFQDTDKTSKPAVILSTVHKAKGLESDRVFMLMHTFKKSDSIEEQNIRYVAITRSRNQLFLVNSN
jgi:superfamily I DNA/RNA helicase